MKAELKIKNFGPIKEANLDLRQTTVFIGPQASGKSTIAKLIYTMGLIRKDFSLGIPLNEQKFDFYFPRSFFYENATRIRYKSYNGDFEYLHSVDNKITLSGNVAKRRNTLYIPAERSFISIASGAFLNLVNNNVPIPKTILEFGAEFEKARSERDALEIDFLNMSYRYLDGEDKIYLGDNTVVKLKESSSGQQNIVPLLVVFEKWRDENTTFIIEEPELNLFPLAQKQLVYRLVGRRKFTNSGYKGGTFFNDLILTTHSPYVLTALNNLLFAYKVAQRHPEKEAEIEKIIPKKCWIDPEDFNAYFVANGTVEQIFNRETGMISENELDSGSDEILEDFDALMAIYKLSAHA